MQIEVRSATYDDVEWLSDCLRLHFSTAYGTKRPFFQDLSFTQDFMKKLVANHIVLIAHKAEQLIGFITGTLAAPPYDPSMICLNANFWWVEPANRRSRAAKLLVDEFIKKGRELADWIFIGLPYHADISSKSIQRKGFQLKERQFLMEVS